MRKMMLSMIPLAVILAVSGFVLLAPYIPSSPTAKMHVVRGTPTVVVGWTDTAATIVRAEVRRRGIRADTTINGVVDTVWSARGYTSGGNTTFHDVGVLWGKTYRYQVRDSIGAVAFSAWSDSVSITVPTRKF